MKRYSKSTKFYVQMTSGDKFQIDALDFNNLTGRFSRGSHHGVYSQRGESVGARNDWTINMKDVSSFWADKPPMEDINVRNIDVEKRLPPEVKPKEDPKDHVCKHDWNDADTYTFHAQLVGGKKRYYKVCNKCASKSTLIKQREVEVYMESIGKLLDDVPLLD